MSGEVRGRNVTRQQQLDLVMVELPDTVYLRYEEQEVTVASLEICTDTDTDTPLQVRDDDRQRAISARLGRVSVECVAEGGRPEPSLSLFAVRCSQIHMHVTWSPSPAMPSARTSQS